MVKTVRCSQCGGFLAYKQKDLESVLEHCAKHSPFSLLHFHVCSCLGETFNPPQKKNKEQMYKTTIQRWQPGTGQVCCPECGLCSAPLIKKQQVKIAGSRIGAACTLGCWPLCFLPFLSGSVHSIHLYCHHCGHFLGTYDSKKREVTTSERTQK